MDDVGEGLGADAVGQRLLLGDAVDVRDLPQLAALPGQRLDHFGVRVAERIHCDARDAVQVDVAVGGTTGARPRHGSNASGARL